MTNPTGYTRPEEPEIQVGGDWAPPSTVSTAVSDLAAASEDLIQPILTELSDLVDKLEGEVNKTQNQ